MLFNRIKNKFSLKNKLLHAFFSINKSFYVNKFFVYAVRKRKKWFRNVPKYDMPANRKRVKRTYLRPYQTKRFVFIKDFIYYGLIKKFFLHFFLSRFLKRRFFFFRIKIQNYLRKLHKRKSRYSLFKNKLYSLNSFDWNKKDLYRSLYQNKGIERIYSFYSFRYFNYKNFRYFFYINKLNYYLDKINENYIQFKSIIFFLLNEFNYVLLGNFAFINVLKDNNRKKNQYFFNVMDNNLLRILKKKIRFYISSGHVSMRKNSSFYLFVHCYKMLLSIVKNRVIWEKKLKTIYELIGNFFYNKKVRKVLNIPYSGKLSLLESFFSSAKRHVLSYSKLRIRYDGKLYARARKLTRMRALFSLTVGKISRLRKYSRFYFNNYIPFKYGMLHLKFVFNNVFVTLTGRTQDKVILKLSSGSVGYKAAAKSTPYTRTSLVNMAIDQAYSLNYKVLDLKFLMRPQHWFFEAFLRKFVEKKMCIRLLFYHPIRIHGYIRFRKKRYL